MDFRYIPKINAGEHEDFEYHIESQEKFYHFVDDFNVVGVNWGQPLNISAQYFLRLLQEGSSARPRGRAGHTSWWDEHDEDSKDFQDYYEPLFNHRAMWRLSGGRVVCTARPYGEESEIIQRFSDFSQRYKFPDSVNLLFLDSSYRFKQDGDHMIMIYNDPAQEEFDTQCSFEELRQKAISHSSSRPVRYQNYISSYARDQYVREYALQRAQGICQLCGKPAPFTGKNGKPYLQVHHIEALSEGGADTIYNTVALCPNCHCKMHEVEDESDVNKLKRAAAEDG